MLGTYDDTRALPWPTALPRRRTRGTPALSPTARQAVRHGLRGAIQAACLSAALMAGAGAVGAAHGPAVLSSPSQDTAHHAAATTPGSAQTVATGATRR